MDLVGLETGCAVSKTTTKLSLDLRTWVTWNLRRAREVVHRRELPPPTEARKKHHHRSQTR